MKWHIDTAVACCRALGLAAVLAFAQPAIVKAAATGWVGDDHAAVRLITAVEATGSSKRLDAGLQIPLAPDWHAYWRPPRGAGIPPRVARSGAGNVTPAPTPRPAPHRLRLFRPPNSR